MTRAVSPLHAPHPFQQAVPAPHHHHTPPDAYEALQAGRAREATAAFVATYAQRAGIEGTFLRGIRRCRLRQQGQIRGDKGSFLVAEIGRMGDTGRWCVRHIRILLPINIKSLLGPPKPYQVLWFPSMGCWCSAGYDPPRAWRANHVVHARPFRRHDEERFAVLASQRARKAAAIKLNRL